ncbi:prephenate dehydrogenase [Ornithinibacillus gellani]|uniref:prephenate dehydrogenase n=1 Tax=Ornithinibacillus gellani TaxID=2293253 RepID=UPI001680C891|nr:prephenate dehydrogenase [Ornithinibacillus gellani]
MKQTIVIAGLGLIGGSIAKGLIQSDQNYIIGYDTNEASLDYAIQHHIIHEATTNFPEAAKQADVLFLAAPISATIRLLGELNELTLDKQVIVSDVASVKSSILATANSLTNEKITFIGGHPMAGSHKKGVQAAKAHLFENAIYVLTPTHNCQDVILQQMKELLAPLKSNFVVLQPNEHDEMTGVVSHFPHLIASSLVHQAKKWEKTHTYLPKLAAGGFRDITRIASSNPTMWQDIFYHNREKMTQLLDEWITEMVSLRGLLEYNDKEKTIAYLEQAKEYRDGLGQQERGAIPAFYDLYVDITDQPGALAAVTGILATEAISIVNIQILEIRERMTGALRLTFSTKEQLVKSHALLQHHGYEVMIEN